MNPILQSVMERKSVRVYTGQAIPEDAVQSSPREPDVGDLLLAVSDANIAAQNAVTAAEAMGIGSCYIGDIMENAETVTVHNLTGRRSSVFSAK